jgi:hypothetical protein
MLEEQYKDRSLSQSAKSKSGVRGVVGVVLPDAFEKECGGGESRCLCQARTGRKNINPGLRDLDSASRTGAFSPFRHLQALIDHPSFTYMTDSSSLFPSSF